MVVVVGGQVAVGDLVVGVDPVVVDGSVVDFDKVVAALPQTE